MSELARAFARRDVAALAADVAAGHTSAAALAERAEARRTAVDGRLNAFLSWSEDLAAPAARVDAAARQGSAGPLAGVPVAVKDNLCTRALPTTCGSRILDGFQAPYAATVVRRLEEAGALVVGKTNLDEFAMGSSTEHSAWGPTRNPWDPTRVPGGSSGGSAAAVAAGIVPLALGSDTGGSVRQPAALCGVVGIKPTWGRLSRYGLVAYASSLDQVGTFGARVADAARLLEALCGPDPLDATASPRPAPALAPELERGLEGLTVGVPREYFPAELDGAVEARCRHALERMRDAGATLRDVSLPHTAFAIPAYYVIAPAEASSNLARYDGVRYGRRAGEQSALEVYEETRRAGFGAEVKRRIMLGTFALSAGYHDRYYGRAQAVRRRIAAELAAVFAGGVDVLFTPTAPGPAFHLGERTEDPYRMYLADVFTVTANLAGIPALSLPVGRVEGLPVGGQLMAPAWGEGVLVRAAAELERLLAEDGTWEVRA
ncbi:MAG TPA: Asp-tRNA(Asn)/Glu-tRNA(Gln) amidotransferase subunit GatA [Longimicrobiales bacterium]|nr:Asp-tRNA(Asn)/Glu-tRNA(Gln) amidotransferase subunit GatA [Longimicrobiales bacterium]